MNVYKIPPCGWHCAIRFFFKKLLESDVNIGHMPRKANIALLPKINAEVLIHPYSTHWKENFLKER